MEKLTYTVNAENRTLGRVASDAASALLGKHSVLFVKHKVLPIEVSIENAGKIRITEKRLKTTLYRHYTGHPGGLKTATLEELIAKKGIAEALRIAVLGMLPKIKLQKERMKRLTISE